MQLVTDFIHANSGLDTSRPYLGMSAIGRCARVQYKNFMFGIDPSPDAHSMAYQGYMYEREMKWILEKTGQYRPDSERHIIAEFDNRFQGNTDGEHPDGSLIEIKSMAFPKFNETKANNRLPAHIYWQVQAYMSYGNYQKAYVWLVNTGSFQVHRMEVRANDKVAHDIERKARQVLQAIDQGRPPGCTCGRCPST